MSFLDILIIKSQNSLTFKIYCKPTNKNDYIHFYSHHNNKIKTGLVIGFYLEHSEYVAQNTLMKNLNTSNIPSKA